ncbi:transcriptional repressor [Acetivibrio mesophilus]|uniref:Uncharacterized protein n=1 Tax=Acetivibrio mesophilus TaxID=2487273 RepID=A0A4Q0I819_9FIRM|nr:hypothetical protein EFD62_01150 [Acetivibrio mesophilus]HHV30336.1 hypothetical protein [Clostridium sp.]
MYLLVYCTNRAFITKSRGSEYRNLNLLSDIGDIRKVEMPNGAYRFDNICHNHYHLRCVK